MLGYLMYRSGLVPRRAAWLGLVGGPVDGGPRPRRVEAVDRRCGLGEPGDEGAQVGGDEVADDRDQPGEVIRLGTS